MGFKAVKRIVGSLADSRLSQRMMQHAERLALHAASLRVLAYHRIDEPEQTPDLYPGLISATPAEFARQIAFLKSHADVVSLTEVEAAFRGDIELPSRAVLLTFDDATTDFAKHAWPILKEHQLPATLFVPTAYPDQPQRHFWWDELFRAIFQSPEGSQLRVLDRSVPLQHASERSRQFRNLKEQLKLLPHAEFEAAMEEVRKLPCRKPDSNNVLGWESLRELSREGVTLAPHTRTHPMLNRVPHDLALDEILGSWEDLRDRIDCPIPRVLAFPAGGMNETARSALCELGFDLAFSTRRGINRLPSADPLALNRINVGRATTLGLLRLQLI